MENGYEIGCGLSTIHIFIPVRSCVGRGPNALLCPGGFNAVKTALALSTTDISFAPSGLLVTSSAEEYNNLDS